MRREATRLVNEMMASIETWVKKIAAEAETVQDGTGAKHLEQRIAHEGQRYLGRLLQGALQLALDQQPESRVCPHCAGRRRHRGRRMRAPLSRLGPIRLQGVYWHCASCGRGTHAAAGWVSGTLTAWMQELVTLLGAALASFDKASEVSERVLGMRVSRETIRRLCQREGQRVEASPAPAPQVPSGTDLVASCDGTMVHVREQGWRELKAYLLTHEGGRVGGAYLEKGERFLPRVRRAAIACGASRARRIFAVSDAAEWIDRGLQVQLPTAIRIVDFWHARQHLYEAGKAFYAKDEPRGRRWGERWSRRLREHGGRVVAHYLRRTRLRSRSRRETLRRLLGYLDRQADRLDYPTYEALGWPISSGPMESYCKQLGRRLKGPGMRWNPDSVSPMASLVTLWADGRWDTYWNAN